MCSTHHNFKTAPFEKHCQSSALLPFLPSLPSECSNKIALPKNACLLPSRPVFSILKTGHAGKCRSEEWKQFGLMSRSCGRRVVPVPKFLSVLPVLRSLTLGSVCE